MKRLKFSSGSFIFILLALFLLSARSASGQNKDKSSQAMPEELKKIFTNSCTPCHTSKGNMMAKSVVNFDEWANYSAEKQSSKAQKISGAMTKGKMPPKSAREKRPEIVPTKEQIEMVQKWADSIKPPQK